jgi:tripartite-type tricarboxylate transporter receptor subunit TctC
MQRRLLLGAALTGLATPALAQTRSWPTRPVRFVVPGAPGTGPDVLARMWGQRLGERLGQSVVVENRAGASGIIGTEAAAQAPADGHNFLFGYNQLVTLNPLLYRRLPYDATKLVPVSLLSRTAYAFIVPRDLPVNTLPELLAMARSKPGEMVLGTPGLGSAAQLMGILLKERTGADFMHVPFRSSPLNEIAAGQVQLAIEAVAVGVALGGGANARAKIIATTGPEREPTLPDVATVKETIPGFEVAGWYAMWAPPGTPAAPVEGMAAAVAETVNDPWLRERFASLSAHLIGTGPATLTAAIARDMEFWGGIVRQSGIVLEL